MTQEDLPFQRHSPTSILAALSKRKDSSTELQRVYRFLMDAGAKGATDEEIQLGLPLNPSTQRPRRVWLVQQGYVRDSGRKRKTTSGRDAVVWTIQGES